MNKFLCSLTLLVLFITSLFAENIELGPGVTAVPINPGPSFTGWYNIYYGIYDGSIVDINFTSDDIKINPEANIELGSGIHTLDKWERVYNMGRVLPSTDGFFEVTFYIDEMTDEKPFTGLWICHHERKARLWGAKFDAAVEICINGYPLEKSYNPNAEHLVYDTWDITSLISSGKNTVRISRSGGKGIYLINHLKIFSSEMQPARNRFEFTGSPIEIKND